MQVEKHIRKNKLKLTFTDQLGKAVSVSQDEESEISSKKEAKKLAFYLFWNMRATLSRFALQSCNIPHNCIQSSLAFVDSLSCFAGHSYRSLAVHFQACGSSEVTSWCCCTAVLCAVLAPAVGSGHEVTDIPGVLLLHLHLHVLLLHLQWHDV